MKVIDNEWTDGAMMRHADECRERMQRNDRFIARLLREESKELAKEEDHGPE